MSEERITIELNAKQAETLPYVLNVRISECQKQLKCFDGSKEYCEYWRRQLDLADAVAAKIFGNIE